MDAALANALHVQMARGHGANVLEHCTVNGVVTNEEDDTATVRIPINFKSKHYKENCCQEAGVDVLGTIHRCTLTKAYFGVAVWWSQREPGRMMSWPRWAYKSLLLSPRNKSLTLQLQTRGFSPRRSEAYEEFQFKIYGPLKLWPKPSLFYWWSIPAFYLFPTWLHQD